MSHRLSQAARHTQELLQDLERDKELDVIRVYLTRLNLFPRQRDPKTAPIRSEELRDLVKHWKLHRQRNFWKNHTTKEDLVRMLYKHIMLKVIPNEKNPLPVQYEPPMTPTPPAMVPVAPSPTRPFSAGTDSPSKRRASRIVGQPEVYRSNVPMNQALDPYGGDLFGQRGDYHSGMIYVSRLAKPEKPTINEADEQNLLDLAKPVLSAPEMEILDEDATQREKLLMAECACSLYQLTLEPGHEKSIVVEGCIPAVVQLCNYDDMEVKKYCSGTIVNISVDPSLCPRMIEEGVLAGLMELAKVQQEDIRRNAAIGICRISYERQGQLRLIQEGSVPALISMLNNTDFETKEACVKTLINIASFSGGNVSESVINTIIRIAAKRDPAPDDGILDPIQELTTLSTDCVVQKMSAMALSNFSGIDTNHHWFATPSLLGVIEQLLMVEDNTIKEMASTAVANLSTTKDSIPLIAESALPEKLIATGYNPYQIIQENVSLAIANIALSHEEHRLLLVQHGLVLLLIELLKDSSIKTRQNAMISLSTLMHHESSRAELISSGIMNVVVALGDAPEPKLRELCAIGLFNFSCYQEFAEHTLAPNVLSCLLSLFVTTSSVTSPKEEKEPQITISVIQEHCLNALYNLSFYPVSRDALINTGAVASCSQVFRKITKNPDLNNRCCVAIANLSFTSDEAAQQKMLEEDVLKLLRRFSSAASASKELLLSCATALCNLAIPALIHSGQVILNVLIDLSKAQSADIALVCSLAFSKLASDAKLRETLSKCLDLPPTLVVMMRSGIEEVQIHCAAALCGMACERGHHRHMWKEGTVSDFIVNSLLRINSESTKEVCARVLFNVLSHEDCRSYFIKEGVLYALIKLARLESLEIRLLCIAALYNLSCDTGMIASLMEANVPHVVSKMCEGEFRHEDGRRKLSACLTNMALAPGQEVKLMEGGILNAVLVLCEHFDPECMKYGASVLCSVSMEPQNCDGLASAAAMELLLRMMSSKDKEQCAYAVNAVCNVSCNSALHDKIEEVETLCTIMHAVGEANEDEEIILTCAKTICNMTYHSKHRSTIMKFHFIRTFIRVFATRPIYLSVASICARILATLSEDPSLTEAMVGEGAVHLLRMTVVDATPETIIYCIVSLCRLSRGGHSGTRILDDGLFDILAAAIPLEYDSIQGPRMTSDMTERCSLILRTLSTYTMCIPQMIDDPRLMPMIKALAHQNDKETCKNCVMLVHNITAARNRTFQKSVRTSGVIRLLINLAKVGSSEEAQICAVALAHINCELSEADRNEIEAYEHGVVATMIGMLDMDPPAMQKAEKISTTLPPLLHWAPPTKEWVFLHGQNKANATCTQAIPVSWAVQDAPIDQSKLTPKEPISYISQLPQQLCEFSPVIKDELYGTFQILQVSAEKSRLKVSARHSHMSLTTVLKTVDPFTHEEVTPPATEAVDEPLDLALEEESNLKEDAIRKSTLPKKPSQRSSSKTNKGSRRTSSMPNTKADSSLPPIVYFKLPRRIGMSHRLSQNARHTQELLQDLERDKELDVLRVYLTRYNLFPRKRDPKTAPIRAEELRDLVKHWKLHRQRNFWKAHTTKEELVRTLYKYINTKILPSEAKPPCTLASASSGVLPARPTTPNNAEAKKASFERKCSYHAMNTNAQGMKAKLFQSSRNFSLEQYSGDLFSQRGEYDDGMIYLSRLGSSIETPLAVTIEPPSKAPNTTPPKTPRPSTVPAHSPHSHHGSTIDARLELIDEDSTSRDVRMKRECACSLYQLSLQVGHERGIVLEGCVPALVRLSLFDDNEVKKYCAAALVNLTCDTTLIAKMIDDGLLGGLMELSKLQHEDVRRNAALGLCRGSYERQGQLRLMQEGSVPAMISMLNSNDYDTKEACIKALINIASFTGAAVSETVVHTIIKLASSRTDFACVHFVAEALANLSLLTGSRIEAVEDGVLDPILHICTLFPTIEIKKFIAIALCNFSGIDSNHADLCQLHVLHCLDMLLDTPDESIRELSSVAVANLSCRPESIRSIIDSNIAIRLIQIGYTQNNSIQENISLALANLAAAEDNDRIFLTRHGVVLLVLQLLRSGSILTKQYAVATLCGLMENEASRNEIVQCDAIEVIISLVSTPKISDYCAVCLLNFSAHSDLSTYLLDPRAIMTLLSLFTQEDRELSKVELKEPLVNLSRVQESCLNCLYNLSFYPSSRDFLINEGAVSSLATVFRRPCKQLELNKRCLAIVCNFSFSNDMDSKTRILYDDALKLIKRLMANTTSKEILLCASSILCNLSLLAIDQPNSPLLTMLMDLSHTAFPEISLNCAMAFSKLSSHPEHGDILAKCVELPPTLTVMMRSGIEEVQVHCATALCGLAAERGLRSHNSGKHLWREGTISDFIVNSLLRINSDSTKEICARVLFNVLTHEDCRAAMIKEGVLYALVKLARLESLEIRTLCVTVMYNLSCDDSMLSTLMEINVAQVIAKMCESDMNSDENRQKMAACLTNMTLVQGYEVRLIESDVLNAILLLCEQGGLLCLRYGASVLCSLSSQRECCEPMATLAITELLIKMIASKDGQQCLFALSALCNISCAPGAHEKLDEAETIAAVLHVIAESEEELVLLTGVKFLHNLSSNVRYHVHLIKHQFLPIILHVFSNEVFQSVADVSAGIIATLSEDQTILNQLVNEGAVKVLRIAAVNGSADTIANCIISLCRLARGGHSGARMLEDGLFDILATAIPLHISVVMSERVALILRTLSTYIMCLPQMIEDPRLIPIVTAITQAGERDTCRHCVMLLHNITAARSHDFQSKAKASGVVPLLIQLSQVGASDIRQVSSVALAHINSELSEIDQSDNYEAGLVSTLITMLDMDTTMMQKVEKIAVGLPPPLKLEPRKQWNFMAGFRATRVLHQIPVIWTSQNTPVDERILIPSEPRTYLSELPHQPPEKTGTIKDCVYGTYSVMRVNGEKCKVKPTPRGIPLSPSSIFKKLHESSPEEVPEIPKENSPRPAVAVATMPPKQSKAKSTPRQRSYITQSSQRSSLPNVLLKRGSSVNLPKL